MNIPRKTIITDQYGRVLTGSNHRSSPSFWGFLLLTLVAGVLLAGGLLSAYEGIEKAFLTPQLSKCYYGKEPYSDVYGYNRICSNIITTQADKNRDVVVIVRDVATNTVAGHLYVRAGSYSFLCVPDGEYQVYFYQGRIWDPNKVYAISMDEYLHGGFTRSVRFEAAPRTIVLGEKTNRVLYDLRKRKGGNMMLHSAKPGDVF